MTCFAGGSEAEMTPTVCRTWVQTGQHDCVLAGPDAADLPTDTREGLYKRWHLSDDVEKNMSQWTTYRSRTTYIYVYMHYTLYTVNKYGVSKSQDLNHDIPPTCS